jgi:alpha-tubulin suppressor-like RCC1 family protein
MKTIRKILFIVLFVIVTFSLGFFASVRAQSSNQPPTVVFFSPTNNMNFGSVSNINVFAQVSDVDGIVTNLDFFSGTNLLQNFSGSLTNNNGIYGFLWTNLPAGSYSITAAATDDSGAVSTTAPLTFTVGVTPPTITSQPASRVVNVGTNVTFSVVATGTAPLHYQWRFNNNNIAGATSNILTRLNVQTTNSGNYSVVITNIAGGIISSNALLTVIANTNVAPTITTQPASQVVNAGTNVTFRVVATGTAPLSYQWQFNNTNIAGATSSILTLLNVQTTDSGNYSVAISNSIATVVSTNALLTVIGNPNVPPTVVFFSPTNNMNFGSVSNIGVYAQVSDVDGIVTNLDFFSGTNLLQSFSGSLTNNAGIYGFLWTNLPAGAYSITARATDDSGAVATTAPLEFTVGIAPPTITSQPASQVANAGTNVTFSVVATGTAPLSYQWQFNNTNIAGATSSILTLLNVQTNDSGNYTVIVTNPYGTITSSAALVVVGGQSCFPPPTGLVAWWSGEGDATDLFGSNNGNVQGGAGFDSGEVGQAFNFDGTNQYVYLSNSPSLNPSGSLSLEAWIYPLASTGNHTIIGKWGDQGDFFNQRSYILDVTADNALQFAITDTPHQWDTSFHQFNTTNNAVPLNQWSHVAAVYDQSTGVRSMYINGVMIATRTDAPITILNSTSDVGIGGRLTSPMVPADFFAGRIDEVAIYHRALSAAEVQAIYSAGSAGKCKAPVAPSIVTQPQDQTIGVGANVTFVVAAAGTSPLSYQWRFNNTNIAGGTSSIFSLSNAQTTDSGNYSVVISNTAGTVVSTNALLTVIGNPNVPPTVVFLSPTNNMNFGSVSNINVFAQVSDVDGIVTNLDFFSGTNLLQSFSGSLTNNSGIYGFLWTNLPAGAYSITAAATDNSGAVSTTAPLTFTISNTLPIITVTAIDPQAAEPSLAGATNTGTFRIQRSVSSPTSLSVQFTMSGTAATNDYSLTPVTGTPGSIRTAVIPANTNSVVVTLRALGDTITEGTETAILTLRTNPLYSVGVPSSATVTILDSASNHPPAVTITSPSYGTTFYSGKNLPFTMLVEDLDANATSIAVLVDDHVLASGSIVMKSINGTNVFSMSTTLPATLPQGPHVVRARVTDSSGLTALSFPINVQVLGIGNRPPASPKVMTMSLNNSTFLIDGDGVLYGWGYNYQGQLGNTNFDTVLSPAQLFGDVATTGWSEISAANDEFDEFSHVMAIDNAGRMFGWGYNDHGQLGLGTTNGYTLPTIVPPPVGASAWKKVAAGPRFTLAIDTEGRLFGWGDNSVSQLTSGLPSPVTTPNQIPFPPNVTSWKEIAAGSRHAVAIADDGNIYTWGANDHGQIGNGSVSSVSVVAPFKLPLPAGVSGWKNVATGLFTTFAISTDGQLFVWGDNRDSQAGNGFNNSPQTTPALVPFPDGTAITEVSYGEFHTTALASDGKLYTWGSGLAGELGNGTTTDQSSPVLVSLPNGVTGWKTASAGGYIGFAIGNDCRVYAWGNNFAGQLGDGTTSTRLVPAPVINLGNLCTAPLVSIISPVDGTVFPYPGNVLIAADASSHDNQVTEVALFQGTNKLASLTSPPYTFTWTNLPIGNYTVIATAQDNLGLTNVSDPVSFSVVFVNQAPTFTAGPDQTATEDSGSIVVPGWASNISSGSAYETNQTVEFSVSNSDETLFATQPAIDAAGNLTFTPAADAFGTAVVSVQLHDNGGTANGGQDTSEVQTFVVTILPVNDAPSFTKGSDQIVLEDAASQSVPAWATGISAGPANEAGQAILFNVSNNNHALFSAQPTIDASGTLTYSLTANASGTATVTVQLQDNGGTENGGFDLSVAQTFTITVLPVNDAPAAESQSVTVNEDSTVAITLTASDVENDALSYALLTAPAHGTLTGDGANLVYHPNANYFGSDAFTFKANDGQADSGVATVTITVHPVNDAPVAVARIAPLFVLSTNDTDLVVIASNSVDATVIFDGSLSTDIENDPLQFTWLDESTTNILGQTMVSTNTLSVGTNTVSLIVNDGTDTSTNTIQVEVITTVDAVSKLSAILQEVDLGGVSKRPLFGNLQGASDAFGEGQLEDGVTLLQNFESRLLNQTSPAYSESVARLIYIANEIIEAVTPPPGN